ncbi:restriction endonuclease subunit S [Pseudomonas koreensis]|uniref:Restriction endonuclease subunit S n=3 Tax=Pseudomonas TaxID=286 RepID=A0A4Q4KUM7_9PSED|nr:MULTISPECIES: restriction endonuclease subunit S [Pseudomonas]MCK1791934.1 hypothetical protein [Pseudomonas violetae]MDM8193940.1 hypothetical protein [Pseudomonas fluorescens]MDP8575185.1 hypothetical protein [Pseudomonas iranensis]RYM37576.1 restriction endonuclease subunit S [Pseudomonas koreensis]
MTFASFKNARIVRSGWLDNGGRRLDCNPYMSGALEARDALMRLGCPKEKLCDLTLGMFDSGRESRNWVNDSRYGVRYMGSSAISLADLSTLPLISNKQVARNPKLLVEAGWSLITRSGTIGRMAYVRSDMAGLACSEDVLRVVPDPEKIPPGYLYAFLSSHYGVPLVVSGTYGAIIQHIEPVHIADLPVPRFDREFERQVADEIEAAAVQRAIASSSRRAAIQLLEMKIGWKGVTSSSIATRTNAAAVLRRMDAFHHSSKVEAGRAALAATNGVILRDQVERVFEPNRGSRLKVTDPAYGIPFLSSSAVFELSPCAEYFVSRSLTPNLENLLLSECDVLLPRSGQLGGIIGRAVLPLPRNVGHAGSEHLVRIRCHSQSDAAYLWAVLASEAGYWASIGTAFGSSIPSLDSSLIGELVVPWLPKQDRVEIEALVRKAVAAQDMGVALETAAVEQLEAKIRKEG